MKKTFFYFLVGLFIISLVPMSACNRKTGCPINKEADGSTKKDGTFKTKKGKTSLFPKGMK